VVLDEQITWEMAAGCVLILVGVLIFNGLISGVRLMRARSLPMAS
jgi:drug/metabolite transporter (DMT)-like permease